MSEILLICAVLIVLLSGFFLMKKLDTFLEMNHRVVETKNEKESPEGMDGKTFL